MSSIEITKVNPDAWVTSTFRALNSYLLANTDPDIYDVINNFPETSLLEQRQPLNKTLIHFEIDDNNNTPLGFGDNVTSYEYDDTAQTVVPVEAEWFTVNFDVGIWASARAGGVTARLNAFQLLCDLFVGSIAYNNLKKATDIELRSFEGGLFHEELINDLPVWRVSNMTLIVRIFARHTPTPIPYIDEVLVVPTYVDVENTTINDS